MAWGAATKATELGGKVVTISGPDGYIYDPAGLDAEKINYMLELRSSGNDIVAPYADKFPDRSSSQAKALGAEGGHRSSLRYPERSSARQMQSSLSQTR